ncbi:hypothetical protein E4U60_003488 [Claviceps pazoutovae]|uniref:Uncharacterized protein n=1 Tax=Claviceps pazoutovae TaxID=1649127 RepID=A0A9P7MA13_9HYPO|nr:hypothetical protein E4U60_003488 [Claviceps pazoutovae]
MTQSVGIQRIKARPAPTANVVLNTPPSPNKFSPALSLLTTNTSPQLTIANSKNSSEA